MIPLLVSSRRTRFKKAEVGKLDGSGLSVDRRHKKFIRMHRDSFIENKVKSQTYG